MKLGSQIYTIKNGQLTIKDQNIQPEGPRIIKYTHTVNLAPDDYHTQQIKQYKQENEQLRKDYNQLQQAYFQLVGYCQNHLKRAPPNPHVNDCTPIRSLYKDGFELNDTSLCDSYKHSSAKVSRFQFEDATKSIEESSKRDNRLSQSILQEEELQELRKNILEEGCIQSQVKIQQDQEMEELLIQAFKEVQQLKEALQTVKNVSNSRVESLVEDYEEKMKNLEQLLEKERKQSRMLNGMITRMRQQLQSKQNFFRAVKEVKNGPEKIVLDKLLKQHRLQY